MSRSEVVLEGPRKRLNGSSVGRIGTEVLASVLASWSQPPSQALLTVLKNNPARRLYERFGFLLQVR